MVNPNKINIALNPSLHTTLSDLQAEVGEYNEGFTSKPDTIIFLLKMWADFKEVLLKIKEEGDPDPIIRKMRGY